MRLIPKSRNKKIAYFKSVSASWAQRPQEIGTTPEAVAGLAEKIAAATAKVAAQLAARNDYLTATQAADNAIADMVAAGGDITLSIRAKAAAEGETIYTLASLPAPTTPTAVKTLGQPTNFAAQLNNDGALTLSWKCVNPRASGTVYQIFRSLDGADKLEFLATAGKKKFVDATLPLGCGRVVYQIQATRSTATGPCARFTVFLGGGMGADHFQVKHAA